MRKTTAIVTASALVALIWTALPAGTPAGLYLVVTIPFILFGVGIYWALTASGMMASKAGHHVVQKAKRLANWRLKK